MKFKIPRNGMISDGRRRIAGARLDPNGSLEKEQHASGICSEKCLDDFRGKDLTPLRSLYLGLTRPGGTLVKLDTAELLALRRICSALRQQDGVSQSQKKGAGL